MLPGAGGEVGAGESRVGQRADHGQPGGPQPAVQFEAEEGGGELRAAVGGGRPVAVLGHQVAEVEVRVLVGDRAEGHHPAPGPRGQRVEQQPGQGVGPQHVRAHMQFEPVGGGPARPEMHQAGVVDQHVDRGVVGGELRRERPHRRQRRQVQFADLGVARDPVGSLLARGEVAHGQNDVRPAPGQLGRGDQAEPGVRAGDDDDLAVLVGNAVGGPSAHLLLLGCGGAGNADVRSGTAGFRRSRFPGSTRPTLGGRQRGTLAA
ncbi:hypothetical protein SALBM217S_06776 [Streptomyces griseoloalbus]